MGRLSDIDEAYATIRKWQSTTFRRIADGDIDGAKRSHICAICSIEILYDLGYNVPEDIEDVKETIRIVLDRHAGD